MKFLIVVFIFLSFPLFGKEERAKNKCEKQTRAIASKSFFSKIFSPRIKWFSADNDQIQNAYCKSSEEKSLDLLMIKNFIKLKSESNSENNKERRDATINGVDLSDESFLMRDAFKNLTTAIAALHLPNPSHQQNIQAKFNINPNCKKVICAVEKIWGPVMGPKMLYLFLKYNFNGSEFAYINTDRFENDELDDVILGLDDIPLFFSPLGRENQRLGHFSRGRTLQLYVDAGTPEVQSNGVVMLFDNWSKQTRFERQYTVFHEVVHNMSVRLKFLDISVGWTNLSGWIKKGDEWSHDRKACFSSDYGASNSMEDFAESASAYRYNGEWFKERCPEKYNFLKEKFFQDLEYLDACSCSPIESTDELQTFAATLVLSLKKKINLESEFKKENCLGDLTNYPANKDDAEACYLKIIKSSALSLNDSEFNSAASIAGITPGKNLFLLKAQFQDYFLNHPEIIEMDSVTNGKILALMNTPKTKATSTRAPLAVSSFNTLKLNENYQKRCALEIQKKDWVQIKKCVDKI